MYDYHRSNAQLLKGALIAALLTLTGCSVSHAAVVPQLGSAMPGLSGKSAGKSAREFLFVGNAGVGSVYPSVTVYNAPANRLVDTIAQGTDYPWPAIGPTGELFVSSGLGTVSVYSAHKYRLKRTLSRKRHSWLQVAVDRQGTAYVRTFRGVVIYPNGRQRRLRGISGQSNWISLDRNDNLYLSRNNSVVVFKEGSTKPFLRITHGIDRAEATAVDNLGNLYVANNSRTPGCGSVNVYTAATGHLEYKITNGICEPVALTIGNDGSVYIVNAGYTASAASTVTVYPIGQNKLLRTITDDLYVPVAIALDQNDNVYVANSYYISVYASEQTRLLREITDAIASPESLTFGP
jgi:hypothetical protein